MNSFLLTGIVLILYYPRLLNHPNPTPVNIPIRVICLLALKKSLYFPIFYLTSLLIASLPSYLLPSTKPKVFILKFTSTYVKPTTEHQRWSKVSWAQMTFLFCSMCVWYHKRWHCKLEKHRMRVIVRHTAMPHMLLRIQTTKSSYSSVKISFCNSLKYRNTCTRTRRIERCLSLWYTWARDHFTYGIEEKLLEGTHSVSLTTHARFVNLVTKIAVVMILRVILYRQTR